MSRDPANLVCKMLAHRHLLLAVSSRNSRRLRSLSVSCKASMRLVQFEKQGSQKIGVELSDGGDIINLTDESDKFPDNMVICVGLNYKDHCEEQGVPLPKEPLIFSKFPSAIIGNGDPIVIPKISNAVDWEVELAVIIGKKGKDIPAGDAMDYVAGYTVAHDVSARDWQMHRNGKQWLLGKTFDTFCPLGPALVTKDAVQDPHKLGLKCLLNNYPMQDSCTDQLVFKTEECIEWISQFVTLQPGDVILTGTPPGVGVFRDPPVYLKPGDIVTCEVESIGKITNPVVAEEDA